MGASRKLQGEIDRVLKKVQEGVEVFDSIWNKVYDTDNANQKEKFEADLKKEIKKLQRYRDQIKTWIQSSEIKDKKALLESRKVIEREMERFKICEKETKTKAFSKEGLGQQPKTDPKEKAKSETRDWLNNVVSELESQIDYFEADLEGLTVKKGKARPPRLAHLETSIARHKAHIMKLELLLRLLDNDELSPEQVNDVKDFLDDYVERNQDDFDEFSDVDELYSSLPLDKVESLEDLVAVAPPTLVKSAGAVSAVASLKPSVTASPTQVLGALPSVIHQVNSNEDQIEEIASQDGNSDAVPRTPPSKSGALSQSALSTSTGTSTPAASMNNPARPTLSAPVSIRGSLDTSAAVASSPPTPINVSGSVKEDDNTNFPSRLSSPGLSDIGLGKEVGKESVVGGAINQSSNGAPLSSSSTIPSPGAHGTTSAASDMANRNVFGADERSGSGGIVQPLISPLTSIMAPPQVSGTGSTDSSNIGDASVVSGRVFSASAVPAVQWRPDSASSFQNQSEPGQFRGRTEFAPDQREKFLQRFQQMQQQKQFSTQQQNSPLQQFNSQTQSASLSAQVGMGPGVQGMGMNSHTSASLLQQNSIHHQLTAQHVSVSSGLKDSDGNNVAVEDQQQLQNSSEGSGTDPAMSSGLNKGIMYGDEFKASYAADASVGGSGSLLEVPQTPRDIDLSPRQPLQFNQASSSLGVIGRRSVSDFGAFGDNPSASPVNSGGVQDQLYNLQMLEAAYYKLPQPKDSERAKTYLPRHPVATPSSYPQVQAPIVDNPAFWERLSLDTAGTDALFFAFYYQQNTYQQYLAARELKKQSWRFHRKYNTWFQRHEEPKVTTDEFEQGTYVYFDFHIANDDLQRGWCQRIKTEFTFEYSYLEDELV